jgi:hypothetical protein
MVSNRSLDRLAEVVDISTYLQAHGLTPHNLVSRDHSGLLLTRGGYVIDVSEALRDISLVITLADARHRLWVTAEGAQDTCAQLGIALPAMHLSPTGAHHVCAAFLSHMQDKLQSLQEELPPVVALLEHVAQRGGLELVAHVAPPPPFHQHPHVKPLPNERLALYRTAVVLH